LATLCLFRDDPYLTEVAATVLEVDDRGGIILDKTVFYITRGGQPGDTGVLKRAEGTPVDSRSSAGCSELAAGRARHGKH
jgi:misacylated tRNA(Ala) deacylase